MLRRLVINVTSEEVIPIAFETIMNSVETPRRGVSTVKARR